MWTRDHKLQVVGIAIGVIGVLIALAAFLNDRGYFASDQSSGASSPAPSTGGGSPTTSGSPSAGTTPGGTPSPVGTIATKIAHTWSPSQQAFLGTFLYPSAQDDSNKTRGPGEGNSITVVCKETGRKMTDTDYETGSATSDAWLRLEDGLYVSALYIDLGPARIADLSDC